jgi:hypothetical protein
MYAHSEAPISITVKSSAGSLVTLRASNAEELDQVVATSIASLASSYRTRNSSRGSNTAVPPAPDSSNCYSIWWQL